MKMSENQKDTNCQVCGKTAKKNDKAMSCDACTLWWHTKCIKMCDTEYKFANSDNYSWYCDDCKIGSKKLRDQMVKMQQQLDRAEARITTLETTMIKEEKVVEICQTELKTALEGEELREIVQKEAKSVLDENKAEADGANVMKTRQLVSDHIKELQECKKRETNLIFHRVKESTKEDKEESESEDKAEAVKIIQIISPQFNDNEIEKVTRLGKKENDKTRPLLIQFSETNIPQNILSNAKKLKDNKDGVSISQDLPKGIREYRSFLLKEAKANQPDHEDFLFKIVGSAGKERVIKRKKENKTE